MSQENEKRFKSGYEKERNDFNSDKEYEEYKEIAYADYRKKIDECMVIQGKIDQLFNELLNTDPVGWMCTGTIKSLQREMYRPINHNAWNEVLLDFRENIEFVSALAEQYGVYKPFIEGTLLELKTCRGKKINWDEI